jgi:hypothetical protein
MTDNKFQAETEGVIDAVEVTIRTSGDDEHLAELVHQTLVSRAEEINQVVEQGTHPSATTPPMDVDWEGWLAGDYDDVEDDE